MKRMVVFIVVSIGIASMIHSQDNKEKTFLAGQYIHDIVLHDQSVWIVTDSFLIRLNKEQEISDSYRLPEMLQETEYGVKMNIDESGEVWIVKCWDSIMVSFVNNQWVSHNLNGQLFLNSIETDKNNNLWVGSFYGLCKYDGEKWTTYNKYNSGLPRQSVPLVKICNDKIWMTNSFDFIWPGHTLVSFDGTLWIEHHLSRYAFLGSLIPDSYDNIWMVSIFSSTEIALLGYDGNEWFSKVNIPEESFNPYATYLEIENDSVFWIGTEQGLLRYEGGEWNHYETFNSTLPSDVITGISIDGDGNKWIATDNGLFVFKTLDIISDTNEYPALPTVQVYPNPAHDQIYISTFQNIRMRDVYVYSLDGKLVRKESLHNPEARIDLTGLVDGIYLVTIQTDHGTTVRKLIKG